MFVKMAGVIKFFFVSVFSICYNSFPPSLFRGRKHSDNSKILCTHTNLSFSPLVPFFFPTPTSFIKCGTICQPFSLWPQVAR